MVNAKVIAAGAVLACQILIFGGLVWPILGGLLIVIGLIIGGDDNYNSLPLCIACSIAYIVLIGIAIGIFYLVASQAQWEALRWF
ncbi:MAG TPA: hypothetical protein VK158_03580 [Acidobacteriota bacterium]|nr:hypothetical protein [Acidobacteriota bacterium]